MPKMRKITKATGAVIERDLVMRYLRRRRAWWTRQELFGERAWYQEGARTELAIAQVWLQKQSQRTKKAGGIGR